MEERLFYEIDRIEKNHWWFAGRRSIVLRVINTFVELKPEAKILDAGCGTGGNLEFLSKLGNVVGLEPNKQAIKFAQKKSIARVLQGELPGFLPFPQKEFDLVVVLDVLEHIDDDESALMALVPLLKPNGHLIITVPAFPFLWSSHDLMHHHRRRYFLSEVENKFRRSGLEILYASYFNTWLFPVIALVRLVKARLKFLEKSSDLRLPPKPINSLLSVLFSSEKHFIGRVRLPFGVSIVACGRRPAD
jgi:SAM-dependent methyltransferase